VLLAAVAPARRKYEVIDIDEEEERDLFAEGDRRGHASTRWCRCCSAESTSMTPVARTCTLPNLDYAEVDAIWPTAPRPGGSMARWRWSPPAS
jgi:hypothetical protein